MNEDRVRAPAFQFYPDKFLAGTERLGAEAFRAYVKVLCWMWLHGPDQHRMRNDVEAVRFATGLSRPRAERALGEIQHPLMPLLRVEGEWLVSEGLRKEWVKQEGKRAKARAAAKTRWDDERSDFGCNADASTKQCTLATASAPATAPVVLTDRSPESTSASELSLAEARLIDEYGKARINGPALRIVREMLGVGQGPRALAILRYGQAQHRVGKARDVPAFVSKILLGDRSINDDGAIDAAKLEWRGWERPKGGIA